VFCCLYPVRNRCGRSYALNPLRTTVPCNSYRSPFQPNPLQYENSVYTSIVWQEGSPGLEVLGEGVWVHR
jgi:hypothetical protein